MFHTFRPNLPISLKNGDGCLAAVEQVRQTVKVHLPRMVCQVRDDNVQKSTCCVATASKSHRAYLSPAKHLL